MTSFSHLGLSQLNFKSFNGTGMWLEAHFRKEPTYEGFYCEVQHCIDVHRHFYYDLMGHDWQKGWKEFYQDALHKNILRRRMENTKQRQEQEYRNYQKQLDYARVPREERVLVSRDTWKKDFANRRDFVNRMKRG